MYPFSIMPNVFNCKLISFCQPFACNLWLHLTLSKMSKPKVHCTPPVVIFINLHRSYIFDGFLDLLRYLFYIYYEMFVQDWFYIISFMIHKVYKVYKFLSI